MVGTWLGEIRSCSCLAVLPDSTWVLLNKIYQPFFTSLYTLTLVTNAFLFLPASEVVRLRYFGAPVEEDLEDFVVVLVGGEDERRDVGRVGGADGVDGLPGVRRPRHVVLLLVQQQDLHPLHVLLGDGQQQRVLHLR